MAGCIVLSILVNILLILGGEDNTPLRVFINTSTVMSGTGSRWRRTLTIPWLVFYGAGIIISLSTHLHFTSKCWREEKVWKASLLVTVVIPTHTGVVCVMMYRYIYMSSPLSDSSYLFSFKLIGLACLCLSFIFLIIWTLVWLVAAQVDRTSSIGIKTHKFVHLNSKKNVLQKCKL